jgi:hypothetical protein
MLAVSGNLRGAFPDQSECANVVAISVAVSQATPLDKHKT